MNITNPEVEAVFASYPEPLKNKLLFCRRLLFEVAAETEGVGALEETLKWGQPSYLTTQTKAGSTLRLDRLKDGGYALFVNCQTNLIDTFRHLYPDEFCYQGNRAVLFRLDDDLCGDEAKREALKHCIALTLTYHLRKKRSFETL